MRRFSFTRVLGVLPLYLLLVALLSSCDAQGQNAQCNNAPNCNITQNQFGSSSNGQTNPTSPSDQPTQVPSPTPSPTPLPPTPTPTAVSQSTGTVLCQADWSSGMNGWTGTPDWKTLNGTLVNDGTYDSGGVPPSLLAPCDLNSIPNYRVEVKVQVQSQGSPGPGFGFYVRYRADTNSGYMVGDTAGFDEHCGDLCAVSISPASDFFHPIENIKFVPGTTMHTYTIEVKDNHIKVFIDGGFITDVIDNRSLNGGSVGFWDTYVQLTVSSFKVTSL